ncbi:MAG: hypothetical protein JXB07_09795 [Anaerolineae bacterium]|nr:hypothetical protein [Anaerolineae bacterium]
MSHSTKKLPDEPIVIAAIEADFCTAQEGQAATDEAVAMLDAQCEPVYYIFDITKYAPSLDDILFSANTGGKGNLPTFRHPKVREAMVVSTNKMIKLAAKGLKSATWGNTAILVFDTLDEALAYIRQQIGKPA